MLLSQQFGSAQPEEYLWRSDTGIELEVTPETPGGSCQYHQGRGVRVWAILGDISRVVGDIK